MAATRPLIEETSGQVPEEGELNIGLTDASGALDDVEIVDGMDAMDGMDGGDVADEADVTGGQRCLRRIRISGWTATSTIPYISGVLMR